MKVLVTGGNQGIGFALCKQLALEHDCHVLLSARSQQKGMDAVSKIESAIGSKQGCKGSVDFLKIDTSDDNSVASAAASIADTIGKEKTLGAIVNNAGIGLNTGSTGDILNTNLHGPKRVCDHFIPFLDESKGRIVNVCSGSGPIYVGSVRSKADRAFLCSGADGNAIWEEIDKYAKENLNRSGDPYGLSKALLSCYTGVLARQHPNLMVSGITPGFIDTQMTAGWGSSKTPEQGTMALRRCLFENLEHGSGWYYGSDGVRSQYHFMRNPGEPEYDGINPYL
jgi:NAD(P)-dependent dehydrogenase (short-subunit alcohol dehydrogenase family)